MSPGDAIFNGPSELIKKKRKLFAGLPKVAQASLAALPLQFPIRWCGNVGPTALSATPESTGGRNPGDLPPLLALIRRVSPCLKPD